MELPNTQVGRPADLEPDGILRWPKEFWIQDSDSGEGSLVSVGLCVLSEVIVPGSSTTTGEFLLCCLLRGPSFLDSPDDVTPETLPITWLKRVVKCTR